jgi:FtsP/CotA-like multicopper oxidase with cupredoxin domain
MRLAAADYTLDIAPYTLRDLPKHSIKTIAYNQQVPGPLLRFREGQPVTIDVTNHRATKRSSTGTAFSCLPMSTAPWKKARP